MRNKMMTKPRVILFTILVTLFTACSLEGVIEAPGPEESGQTKQTPVASDFTCSALTQGYDGNSKSVSIYPNEGKSGGVIIIYYEGTDGTFFAKSTTPPSEPGSYTITIDVASAPGFNAAYGLYIGTLVITHDKIVTAGPQNNILLEMVGGSVTFTIFTANIDNGIYPITVLGLPDGIEVLGDANIIDGSGVLTLISDSFVEAGSHELTFTLVVESEQVTSLPFTLIISENTI